MFIVVAIKEKVNETMIKRHGGTLLNVSISLIVIISLITTAVYHSGLMLNEQEARDEVEVINTLAEKVRTLKGIQGYKSSLVTDLVDHNMLPHLLHGDKNGTQGVIKNRWGGMVDVVSLDNGANFGINYYNMPNKICLLIAQAIKPSILYSMGKGLAHNQSQKIDLNNKPSSEIKEMCSGSALNRVIYFSSRSAI